MVMQLLSIEVKRQNFTLYMHLHCVKICIDYANLVVLLVRNFFYTNEKFGDEAKLLEKNPKNILPIYNTYVNRFKLFQLGRFQSFFVSVLNTDCRFAEKKSLLSNIYNLLKAQEKTF